VSEPGRNLVYESGQWQVHLDRRELLAGGLPVPLGARAFEIVEVLVRSNNELVSKDDLMGRIWPGATVGDNTLQVHISAIRKALGQDRALLQTASGRGYRLLGNWTLSGQEAAVLPVGPQHIRATTETAATNFPAAVTSLVGRSAALQRVRDLVSAYRVVTLVGPGGIGKTTLALEVARDLLDSFHGGGWLVELGSLSDPELVPSAVAGVLDLNISGETISPGAVARAIGGQHLLLVLDNCEHVIDAVANLTELLVRSCPQTTILATSREVLRTDGEYVYRVSPLEVPAAEAVDPGHILQHSAVELFITRTKAQASDFSPRPEDLRSIAAICRRLDGIPLAIEFAAAHTATLGIQQVAAGLSDRFALLTSGRRTALARHRTLRATLDWSYILLPAAEQRLLRHLGVFAGGFTLEATASVMRHSEMAETAILDGLAGLVARSLVTFDGSAAPDRWRLLETIRAYAFEKLDESGETDGARRHHAEYFRDLFVPESGSRSRLTQDDLAVRVREIDNVRAALDWAFSAVGDAEIGIDLTAAYGPVWLNLSLMAECRERCDRALREVEHAATPNPQTQMWLQIALGSSLIDTMGDVELARTLLAKALETAETIDDLDAEARALIGLMTASQYHGERGRARIAVNRVVQIAERLGDPAVSLVADRIMATMLLTIGRLREAQPVLDRIMESHDPPQNRGRALWYSTGHRASDRAMLSRLLWLRGLVEQAHREAQGSLDELGPTDPKLLICRILYIGMCRLAPMTGDFAAAEQANARLIEVATGLNARRFQTLGRFLDGKLMVERGEFAHGLAALRDGFEICRQTGWRMSYPEFNCWLAVAQAGVGQLDEALDAVEEGLIGSGQGEDGQRWYVPELLRIKGEITLRQGMVETAEGCFLEALSLAQEQGALFWELRVAVSLAHLRAAQRRPDEARQILAPVYAQFTEGFATTDLRSAKALLDALTQ
jgi:predicted ATPase